MKRYRLDVWFTEDEWTELGDMAMHYGLVRVEIVHRAVAILYDELREQARLTHLMHRTGY